MTSDAGGVRFDVPLYSASEAYQRPPQHLRHLGPWVLPTAEGSLTSSRGTGGHAHPDRLVGAVRALRWPRRGFCPRRLPGGRCSAAANPPGHRPPPGGAWDPHVLASKSLYTDGAEVLYDYAESTGDTPEGKSARELVVVWNDQRVFQEVVDSYLRRIDFAADGWAHIIHLPQYRTADVVVDPERSFGIPIFARGAARVEVVLGRVKAGESVETLSEEFGIPPSELFDALRVHTDTAA